MINWFKRLPIATKLWFLIATFTVVGLTDNLVEMSQFSTSLRTEKETQLRLLVETALNVVQNYERAEKSGLLPPADAKVQAIKAIRQLRYNGNEYFWIHDLSAPIPRMVMHPTVPELDGRYLNEARFEKATSRRSGLAGDYQPIDKTNLFVAMNQTVQATGDGFVTYDWHKPLTGGGITDQLFPKLSYVKRFDTWGWVLGSGIYIDDLDTAYWRGMELRILKAGLWVALLGILVWAITKTVVQPLGDFQRTIDALRSNPDSAIKLPTEQPGELGHLTRSFQSLMEDLRQSRTELMSSNDQLRLASRAFANMSEGVVVTDVSGHILSVNPAFTRINGYTPDDVLGKTPRLLRSGIHDNGFYIQMWTQIQRTGSWAGEIWNKAKDGRIYPEWLSISASRDKQGTIRNYVGVFSDITERKHAESQIRFLAEHDSLTGLPNRALMLDRLEQAIQKAIRSNTMIGVLFVDLDHFKHINDSLGHAAGDELLRQVALRLHGALRASDTLSRTGGDEFIALLPELSSANAGARVTESMLATLTTPIALNGHDVVIGASIGISMFPIDGDNPQRLIQCADMAMYHSKENGRNSYHYYTEDMNARVFERMSLEHRIRQALDRNEFLLHFQPQVSTQTGQIIGVEALARWQHPDMGMIPPGRFIPVAEDSGLILRLGQWVLRDACQHLKSWLDAGLPRFTMAINISAVQFREANFVDTVRLIIEDTGVPPELLELELTESIIMDRVEHTISRMHELKQFGVKLSIDDFGTGYSSLTYLKRFPIDKLKIDQSFVRGIADAPQDAAIVRAIITLANSLELTTIAEGVESAGICGALRALGCDEIQGYFYSRPIPDGALKQLIAQWRPEAAMRCSEQARAFG